MPCSAKRCVYSQVKILSAEEQTVAKRFDFGPDADDLAVFRKKNYNERRSLLSEVSEKSYQGTMPLEEDSPKMVSTVMFAVLLKIMLYNQTGFKTVQSCIDNIRWHE